MIKRVIVDMLAVIIIKIVVIKVAAANCGYKALAAAAAAIIELAVAEPRSQLVGRISRCCNNSNKSNSSNSYR